MTHEEIISDLALYALGSLDADERRAVERHLAGGCDTCERELERWVEVAGSVPLSVDEAEPPNLKPRLLERIETAAPRHKVLRPRSWVTVPLAAAALAMLALGFVREMQIRAERRSHEQVVADLSAKLSASRDALEEVRTVLAQREMDIGSLRAALAEARETLAVVGARGLRMVTLQETPDAPPANAHLLFSEKEGKAIFYAFGLPPVEAGKTYELWWITEKEGPLQAGLFVPDQRGLGQIEAMVPVDAGAVQAAAVTIEPAGGLPKPSGPMVLLGKLAERS
jgi:anti-sigma-K factor RskA